MNKSSISFILSFSLLFIILLITVLNSSLFFKHVNPYSSLSSTEYVDLDGLSVSDVVVAKLTHGAARDRAVDVGVFGNSRSVMLQASQIPILQGKTFFNYSVGGTAFQQSVRSLEYLAGRGVAPKTAIISIDNTELQFVGLPYWPQPIFDGISFLRDLSILFGEEYGGFHQRLKDAVKLFNYFSGASWRQFELAWNFDKLTRRVRYLWRGYSAHTLSESPNLATGSRRQTLPDSPVDMSGFKPQTSMPRAENRYLLIGLRRLAEIARRHGTRIVVYESPLAPELAMRYTSRPTAPANETRKWFRLGCEGTPLECHAAPILPVDRGELWPDCCHAPANALGAYVSGLLQRRAAN